MPNLIDFDSAQHLFFFIVLLRISGIFITAPILSAKNVPIVLRISLSIILALIFYNRVPPVEINYPDSFYYYLLAFKELMVGLLLGVIPTVMFAAINFAGTIIGFMMGFSIVNVLDPQSQTQISIIASMETILATFLFVVLDGHHIFIKMIGLSYETVPIAGFGFHEIQIKFIMRITADLFIVGFQLGAPLIIALLLANIIMGFMARSIPQLNIFVVGFPITIGLGLLLLFLGLPHLMRAFEILFFNFEAQIIQLINLLKAS